MTNAVRPPRSGCAVVSGVFLVAVGSLFLVHNLLSYVGASPLRVAIRALVWFGTYWPLFFIAWGLYKLYQRRVHPRRSFVTATEVIVLAWILVGGLAIRGAQQAMEELSVELSIDDFAGVLGPDVLGPVHRFVENETFELDGALALTIENERGQVVVLGGREDERAVVVTVTKELYSFSETDAERSASAVSLELEITGNEARLVTARSEAGSRVLAHLELRVPRTVSVRVDNERGAVRVVDLEAPVAVSTTHGDVEIANVASGVDAQTSHATIRLDSVTGPANLRNRHGEIYAIAIAGELRAETENSAVTVEGVTGDAVIETRFGRVRARDVSGDVEVRGRHSAVSLEKVGGGATITSDSRPVFVTDVAGDLTLATRNASVMVRAVGGDVSVDNEYRMVSISDVRGTVEVKAQNSAVDVDTAGGTIAIESSHDDVRVANFSAGLDVRSSHADVAVSSAQLSGPVHIETSYGDVSLRIPPDASIELTANTRDGELLSNFTALVRSSGEPEGTRWTGVLGTGTHPVTIITSYGDITVSEVSP